MKPRIERVAYVGWRGIHYEEIEFHEGPLTGLVGPSGAGKSTLVMCLDYALLPDRKVLDVRPISDLQDPHQAGIDSLAARIDPKKGYAYVALDITGRRGVRVIAGIHVRAEDGRAKFTRWRIREVPKDTPLQDFLRVVESDQEYYPDFGELRRRLAERGIDLEVCRTVSDYGQTLYEAGVLPTNLMDLAERSLYGRLIETTFRGGISAEVATKLKDYLLPAARRVPETVSRLQESADQVFRTRRALADAKTQLMVLETTYGTGKAIVVHALRHATDTFDRDDREFQALERDVALERDTVETLGRSLPGLANEITVTEGTIRTLEKAKQEEIKLADEQKDQAATREQERKSTYREAAENLRRFQEGEKHWRIIAGEHVERTREWVDSWLKSEAEKHLIQDANYTAQTDLLIERRDALATGQGQSKSALLAEVLNADSLEEALDDLPESEARAMEMALAGLIDGVVGADIEALVHLQDDPSLPEIFWLRDRLPDSPKVSRVGQWHLWTGSGGFIVSSDRRKLVFGRQARENEIAKLDGEIRERKAHVHKRKEEHGHFESRRTALNQQHEAIDFYIARRDHGEVLRNARDQAKIAHESAESDLKAAKARISKLNASLFADLVPHRNALSDLRARRQQDNDRLVQARSRLADLQPQLDALAEKISRAREELDQAAVQFGSHGVRLQGEAQVLEPSLGYVAEQTRRLVALFQSLDGEPPARLTLLQDASAEDASSCMRLWPMLMDVVRDRVAAELLDTDGEDILRSMRERRSELDGELSAYETDMKRHAKSIYQAIQSEIAVQQNRIRTLSRSGEKLRFGNVTGIRIRVETRRDMLNILEGMADQLTLFTADPAKPVDVLLQELFVTMANLRLDGKTLLDYRTYMDLLIDARRATGPWEPVRDLSGGESIGCGLAISLMLSRSLASRGEIKADEITPLFAIDEVQRLDDAGQGVIVEFGQREGFQVLVTAPTLAPRYPCRLYVLARHFDPEDRIVLRALEVKDDIIAAAPADASAVP